jgi:hypothetical protein
VEFTVTTKDEQGYLRVQLTGGFSNNLPEAIEQYARLTVMAYSTGHTRFLVDARAVKERMTIPTTFEFATLAYPEEPDPYRTAALDLPVHILQGRFFENLMRSRGRAYRLFHAESEAVEWLLSDRP